MINLVIEAILPSKLTYENEEFVEIQLEKGRIQGRRLYKFEVKKKHFRRKYNRYSQILEDYRKLDIEYEYTRVLKAYLNSHA